MIYVYYLSIIFILYSKLTLSNVVTFDLTIPLWNIATINSNSIRSTCQQLNGNNYIYNSILQSCVTCTQASTVVDTRFVDGKGNYVQCECANGYYAKPNTCYNVDSSGNCNDYTCESCLSNNMVSYSDHYGCAYCGNTTLGISTTTNECRCQLNQVLVESDQFGNLYSSKSCHICPFGKLAILINTQIVGKNYIADYYTCQSCPDPLMTMTVSSNGDTNLLYSCTCPNGKSIS